MTPGLLLPKTVKVWPLVGLAAIRSNLGGGWRLYCLAKSLDGQGRGYIYRDDLTAYVLGLGVSKKTLRRWMTEARNNDLVSDIQSRSGRWRLILAGHHKAAAAVGCQHVGNRRVEMSAAELVSKGWRSVIWAAYATTTKGKPIKRTKQAEITGVTPRMQRHYQLESGRIVVRRNFAISDTPADHLDGIKEFSKHAAPFSWFDKETGRRVVAWRLPNSYSVIGLDAGQRGRSRKVNKSLSNIRASEEALFQKQQGLTDCSPDIVRLFNRTQEQVKATDRKLASRDNQPSELYRLKYEGQSVSSWDALAYAL